MKQKHQWHKTPSIPQASYFINHLLIKKKSLKEYIDILPTLHPGELCQFPFSSNIVEFVLYIGLPTE